MLTSKKGATDPLASSSAIVEVPQEAPLPGPCTCLQQHAEFLSNPVIREMNACNGPDDSVLSLDKALSLAKQGINAWRSLTACPDCPYNNDHETMLLAFMSIRTVTRYLQRLAPRYTAQPPPGSSTPEGTDSRSSKERSRLTIGSLEIEDDERTLVLRLLFHKTLQKVRCALHSLQTIQYKRKGQLTVGVHDGQTSSSLPHIQQISHALAVALQALDSTFSSSDA